MAGDPIFSRKRMFSVQISSSSYLGLPGLPELSGTGGTCICITSGYPELPWVTFGYLCCISCYPLGLLLVTRVTRNRCITILMPSF